MFLEKYEDKQFFRQHNISTGGEFVAELSSDAGIPERRIVWVTIKCLIVSDILHYLYFAACFEEKLLIFQESIIWL